MSLFFGGLAFWSGEVYSKISKLVPLPQRTRCATGMAARGLTLRFSFIQSSLNGPKGPIVKKALQPITPTKKSTACWALGTVKPKCSTPRMPGTPACAAGTPASSVAAMAQRRSSAPVREVVFCFMF